MSQQQIFQNTGDESMSSRQDFHANPLAWPDSEKERKITVTSGRKLSELYVKSGPLGLLARMLLESSRWYSPARKLRWEAKPIYSERLTEKEYCSGRNMLSKQSAEILSVKDIPSSRLLFRLVPSERPTGETECGLLPTVQTDGISIHPKGKGQIYMRGKALREAIEKGLLPTPTVLDSGGGRINKSPSPGARARPTIALAAKMGLLPTPTGRDFRNGSKTEDNKTQRKLRKGWTLELNDMASGGLLPTPNAIEATKYAKTYNPKSQMGSGLTAMACNGMIPCANQSQQTGGKTSQLNPRFVSEMMSFPPDWTELPFLNGDKNP